MTDKYTQLFLFLFASSIVSIFWLFHNKNNELESIKREQTALLENYNTFLEFEFEKTSDRMEEEVKRKREYRKLYSANIQLTSILKSALKPIDQELVDHKYTGWDEVKKSKSKIESKLATVGGEIFSVLTQAQTHRNLGIKPKEILILKRKLRNDFATLYLKEEKNDPLTYHLDLLKKKNSLLSVGYKISDYLCSKIGSTTLIFDRFMLVSSSESFLTEPGDKFSTKIFLSTALSPSPEYKSATINGVEYPIKDGVVKFSEIPTVKGWHHYTVHVKVKNRFTGKMDSFKKTFRYLVK